MGSDKVEQSVHFLNVIELISNDLKYLPDPLRLHSGTFWTKTVYLKMGYKICIKSVLTL